MTSCDQTLYKTLLEYFYDLFIKLVLYKDKVKNNFKKNII